MIYVFVFYLVATNLQVIDERLFNKDKWLFKEFYTNYFGREWNYDPFFLSIFLFQIG